MEQNAINWTASWISDPQSAAVPLFFRKFRVKNDISSARLYICGLGHFSVIINGREITDTVLNPGWSDYEKTHYYKSFDVSEYLAKGENSIGVHVANGMYHVPPIRYAYHPRSYGEPRLIAQLEFYDDAGLCLENIVTDNSWLVTDSSITFAGIYGGEDRDGRIDDAALINTEQASAALHNYRYARELDYTREFLKPDISPSLRVMQKYRPVSIKKIDERTYLYDLGVNFSGWTEIVLSPGGADNCEGAIVRQVPGEILDDTGRPDQRVTGQGYAWTYTMAKARHQLYHPRFTYYGFRYVEVQGAIPSEYVSADNCNLGLPVVEKLAGCFIYPDVTEVGKFTCSDKLLNGIYSIIRQSVLSNMKSVLTDCPHREKLGWLEQTHLIGPSIMWMFDVRQLYQKIQNDIADAQHDNGLIPDICPEFVKGFERWHQGFLDSPEWGSAGVINPWLIWQRYGDDKLIREHFDVMERYVQYLTSKTHHYVLHHGLGDWLDIGPNTPHSQNTPIPVIATAVYYYDLRILMCAAKHLGHNDKAEYWLKIANRVKYEFNLQFFDDQTGRYATGSQAAQAMCLMTGLVEEGNEQRVFDYLIKDIIARDYVVTAGDIGHPFVTAALIAYDRADIMYKMLKITDKPGYGYQVKHGATTLTEEWDGPDPDRPHGSQNHLMLGSAAAWFWEGLAGLRIFGSNRFDINYGGLCDCKTDANGLRREIIIRPHFPDDLNQLKASYQHPYGLIEVEWYRQEGSEIKLTIKLPEGLEAKFINELSNDETNLLPGTHQLLISRAASGR